MKDFTLEGNLDDGLQADFAVYVTNYVQELTGIPFASTNETAYTLPFNGGSCLCDDDSFFLFALVSVFLSFGFLRLGTRYSNCRTIGNWNTVIHLM
jgi:hypothetical protein